MDSNHDKVIQSHLGLRRFHLGHDVRCWRRRVRARDQSAEAAADCGLYISQKLFELSETLPAKE